MKIFLEEKIGEEISTIKEITDIKEASKGQFIHKCRHDETPQGACERIKI